MREFRKIKPGNNLYPDADRLHQIRGPESFREEGVDWVVSEIFDPTVEEGNEKLRLIAARSVIKHQIKELLPHQQMIIILKLKGWSGVKIAKKLKISPSSVSYNLKRIGKKLRKFIPTFQ